MPPLLLSLPTILSAAKEVFGVGRQLYSYVAALRDAARQNAEWTEAQDAHFAEQVRAAGLDPAWQPRS